MTRPRVYGEDTPFCAWLRGHDALDSVRDAFTAHDVDLHCHKYKANVDGVGTRDVQLLMMLEIKTRGAMPSREQKETLFFQHQCQVSKRKRVNSSTGKLTSVWNFGCSLLSLPAERPDDAPHMRWCRFDPKGKGKWTIQEIDEQTLVRILAFDIDPDSLMPLSLRRHHKTSQLWQETTTPLGFQTVQLVVARS